MKNAFQLLLLIPLCFFFIQCRKESTEQSTIENNSVPTVLESRWLDPALVAYYPFDNNRNDYAGKGSQSFVGPYTYIEKYTSDRHDNASKALFLDGNYILDLYNIPIATAYTISAWVVNLSSTTNILLISQYGYGLNIFQNKNKYVVEEANPVNISDVSTLIPRENWHHVVGTYDGREIRIYMDGILKSSKRFNGRIADQPSFYKLAGFGPPATTWRGYIDDLMFYKRTLSQSEVSKLYNDQK